VYTLDRKLLCGVATGQRGYQFHRHHRCPGTHPLARGRFFACTGGAWLVHTSIRRSSSASALSRGLCWGQDARARRGRKGQARYARCLRHPLTAPRAPARGL
jgi:hypothetical protein